MGIHRKHPDFPAVSRLSEKFLNYSDSFQTVLSFFKPDDQEGPQGFNHIKTVSWLSWLFTDCPDCLQTVLTVSRLSGNFPDFPDSFQTVQMIAWLSGRSTKFLRFSCGIHTIRIFFKLSRQFPICLDNFQTVWALSTVSTLSVQFPPIPDTFWKYIENFLDNAVFFQVI